MNYQDLQDKYSRKKQPKLKNKQSQLPKGKLSASTWKDYKDWLKEQQLKQQLQEKAQKRSKRKKTNNSQQPKNKNNRKAGNSLKTPSMTYSEQLKDPRWIKKRQEVLEKKGHICSNCGKTHNLQVHHLEYKKDKMAWEYSDSTLVVLCKDCHEEVHRDHKHYLHPKYEEIWYNIDIKGLEDYEATRFGRIRHKDTKKRIQWSHFERGSDDNETTQKIIVNGKWVSKSEVLKKLY